ncbi:hypothetical protein SDC9_48752 [bioreactor metagenome]|uniref:DUF2279 domain-containing protein n=1 Tax=bioreactor metagenome TaxID=1076179 RepID=A0A644WJ04_9ZZZZ
MLQRICLIVLCIFTVAKLPAQNNFSPNFPKVSNFGKVFIGLKLFSAGDAATADTTAPLFKKWQVNTFAAAFYAGSLTGLSFLWYSDYSTGRFHFFNDMDEWKGIDKLGHMTSAFHLARVQSDLYQNAGYSRGQSARISLLCSFGYMSAIEILDGFSEGWGFSAGDMCANTLGLSLFAVNELTGKENLFTVKMGFHYTDFAQYNPSLLGENKLQQPLKDYNGQTYWLSLNIKECLKKESRFPAWLNVAVGYGAEGMTGAEVNPAIVDGKSLPEFARYSQWYIAPDIDFSKIPVRGRGWKLLLRSFNFLKFPAPALEWNAENGLKMHYLYF